MKIYKFYLINNVFKFKNFRTTSNVDNQETDNSISMDKDGDDIQHDEYTY